MRPPPTSTSAWRCDLARPRPQDFDPDPQTRRRRTALPPHVRADPWSIPNILHALRAASLKARAARLGDPPHDAGHIQIETPIKGRSRFVAIAQRDEFAETQSVCSEMRSICAGWAAWPGGGSGTATRARPGWRGTVARCDATRAWSRCSATAAAACKRTCSVLGADRPPVWCLSSPGAFPAGAGHPGRRDACLFLPTPSVGCAERALLASGECHADPHRPPSPR